MLHRNSRFVLTLVMSFFTLLLTTSALADSAKESLITTHKINNNTYALIVDDHLGSNVGVVVDESGLLLIDAMEASQESQLALEKALKAISDKPVKYVINTHAHRDHAGGNQRFADQGATIISQQNINYIPKNSHRFKATYNQLLVNDVTTIRFGGQKIVLHPVMSHTFHDLIVHLPNSNVVFTGDNHATNWGPNIGGTGIQGQTEVMDLVISLSNDKTKMVPGHGVLTNLDHVVQYKENAQLWLNTVQSLHLQGMSSELMLKNQDISSAITFFAGSKSNSGFLKPENLIRRINRTIAAQPQQKFTLTNPKRYIGNYKQQQGADIEVVLIKNVLYARRYGDFVAQLVPLNQSEFALRGWDENEKIVFTLSSSNQVKQAQLVLPKTSL